MKIGTNKSDVIHIQNMCRYGVITGEAVQTFVDLAEYIGKSKNGIEEEEAGTKLNHIQASRRDNRNNQHVRDCLSVFEGIIEVSIEDTYKAVNMSDHGDTILSSAAHIGNQISQCKAYLEGTFDVSVTELLENIYFTLGNMMYTSIELFRSITQANINNESYSEELEKTSIDSCIEEIYNIDGNFPEYYNMQALLQLARDEVIGFDTIKNPYVAFGADFLAHNNIELQDDSMAGSEGLTALTFEEADDSFFKTED